MNADERLICDECGEDLRIVSVGVGLGHVVNPTFRSHYPVVRQPSAAQGQQSGAVRHGTSDRRSPRAGRVVPNASVPVTPSPSSRARRAGAAPRPHVPRPAPSAGALDAAGERG